MTILQDPTQWALSTLNNDPMQWALSTVNQIATVNQAAKEGFIERQDAIDALTTALASGDHIMLLSKPGTAKTLLGSYFAKALGLDWFYYSLDMETDKDALMGPIDPRTIETGDWDRIWTGVADCDMALVDEAGKAPGNVQNLLLGAMEERRVVINKTRKPIPLHTMMSATNETLMDNPAFWDRFTLRVKVDYIKDAANFHAMLTSDVDNPPDAPVTRNDLANLRGVVKEMALSPVKEATQALTEMWSGYKTKFKETKSDRRWRRILRVAAGAALLRGAEQVEVEDLHVAKWMLWDNDKIIPDLYAYVETFTDQETKQFTEIEALFLELQRDVEANCNAQTTSKVTAEYFQRSMKIERMIKPFKGKKWQVLLKGLGSIQSKIKESDF